MTSKQHLHPIALLPIFYRTLHDWLIPIVGVIWAQINLYAQHPLLSKLLTGLLILFILVFPILRYWRFTYQLTDQAIIIRQGIFVRKVNHVPYPRIQNVTVDQWFFLKPFNLGELLIETAGQTDNAAEVRLTSVPLSLQTTLNQHRHQQPVSIDHGSNQSAKNGSVTPKYTISRKNLWVFATTSPAFLTALIALAAMYGRIQHSIPKQFYTTLFQEMGHLGIVVIFAGIVGSVALIYLLSVVAILTQYYHFQLTKSDQTLTTMRGLFQTKTTSMTIDRIQAIRIRQPLLRGWLQRATLQLVIVSNAKKDDAAKNLVIMPLIRQTQMVTFLQKMLPEVPSLPEITQQVNGQTRYYNWRNSLIWSFLILVPLIAITWHSIWLSIVLCGLVLLNLVLPAELQTQRTQLQPVTTDYLYVQNNRWFTRDQYLIPHKNIQAVELRQSKWLLAKKLGTLKLTLRSGNGHQAVTVRYLPIEQLQPVMNWYRAAATSQHRKE